MNYEIKMDELLEKNLTKTAFDFWNILKSKIPPVWSRPTSSTGKYHKKEDGSVPNIAEHTYEMLYACINLWRMFDIKAKTSEGDTLLLAVALHDSYKYGKTPEERQHTVSDHDKIIADKIKNASKYLESFLQKSQVQVLEEATRFHNGRWSKDANMNDFNFSIYHPYTNFVHMLDMMSANNLIKMPLEKE